MSSEPSETYALIWRAVRERQQLVFAYDGYPREVTPVILGYDANGQEALSAYQFAGATSGTKKLPDWRCFKLPKIRDLATRPGAWKEGRSHTQPQSCVQHVDVDANIPETLTREKPLPFGSPELRPPRRGA
jgi:predicted DNA-binding transcriptional regulator YafY